ncbi:MAG: hypothetical protein AVO34_03270 [Firmicutes bacterium ML8_F2]|nr:MAG: hypothetical protein AVO34_03270 [Firmicutes bacterium ML8_F2]
MENNILIYQVSEINRYIKGLLHGDPRLRDIRVAGEISNFKHHRSGHMYFTLKDGNSALRCVFFRRENQRCPFRPEDGLGVVTHGNISVYEPDGVYQLYVLEMEPEGMGSLFLAFEQLKKKLEAEGIFRAELKKELPFLPRKIAVITSPTGAALHDIVTTLQKRSPQVDVLIVESLVQGSSAAADIERALDLVNRRQDIDLIILARGGGSLEDLWPFNEERVARAIYRSDVPVISAVGHETDFTIADFAADLRAPTPTAGAQAAVPERAELLARIDQLRDRCFNALQRRMQQEKQILDHITGERFFRIPAERIRLSAEYLGQLSFQLRREMIRLMQMKEMKLAGMIDKLENRSPLKVMNRGYSFCRDEEGGIIHSVKDVQVGQVIRLTFIDGRAGCRTEWIEEDSIVDER